MAKCQTANARKRRSRYPHVWSVSYARPSVRHVGDVACECQYGDLSLCSGLWPHVVQPQPPVARLSSCFPLFPFCPLRWPPWVSEGKLSDPGERTEWATPARRVRTRKRCWRSLLLRTRPASSSSSARTRHSPMLCASPSSWVVSDQKVEVVNREMGDAEYRHAVAVIEVDDTICAHRLNGHAREILQKMAERFRGAGGPTRFPPWEGTRSHQARWCPHPDGSHR